MLGSTDVHLIECIGPRGRSRIVDLTGRCARVGLLIIRKRSASRHKHGFVIEEKGAVSLAMQIQGRRVAIGRRYRKGVEKLSGRRWRPAMASGREQHPAVCKQGGSKK